MDENLEMMNNYEKQVYNTYIQKLRSKLYDVEVPLATWQFREAKYHSPGKIEFLSPWKDIRIGEVWDGDTLFFKTDVVVGDAFHGRNISLSFDNMGECLLYLNGEPRHGFDQNRQLAVLAEEGKTGTRYEIIVESCPRWQTKAHAQYQCAEYPPHVFKKASLVSVNRVMYDFVNDMATLVDYYLATKQDAAKAVLTEISTVVNPNAPRADIIAAIPSVRELISNIIVKGAAAKRGLSVAAVGHSHIDVAYLWPVKETVRKCARTFSNMLGLLDSHSNFFFSQSQPLLYKMTKEHYPSIYDRIKAYVKEGRWEVMGGMWVEADCNLPSGESLVRQFLYGMRFIKDEFGVSTEVCWHPDTFGFCASLPQIMKKCGCRYFYATKLNANQTNTFPHNIFQWEGIDGTSVLSVVGSFMTYGGNASYREVAAGVKRYHNRKNHDELLYAYGHGDGGGGVTGGMIENIERMNAIPEAPAIAMTRASDFFKHAEASARDLPVWYGDLYLENHQGTYTSQAAMKQQNRKSEILYRDVELLSVLAGGTKDDRKALHDGWELILVNQFHDIIPGSSIAETYRNTNEEYKVIFDTGYRLRQKYLDALLGAGEAAQVNDAERTITVFNTLSFERSEMISLEIASWPVSVIDISTGKTIPSSRPDKSHITFYAEHIPAFGYTMYRLQATGDIADDTAEKTVRTDASGVYILENQYLSVRIDRHSGNITGIFDKECQREALDSRGACLEIYAEIFDYYDAWDIWKDTLANAKVIENAAEISIIENTALLGKIRVTRAVGKSSISQIICMTKSSRRIDIVNDIDWHETGMMLKAAVNTSVFSTRATYDIAYGNFERSTRRNTSWEQAQYEVAAHKWADISERDYGVALLNDCKYGYSASDGRLTLTLLKSPKFPDSECDMGKHHFVYSIFPHRGDWRIAGVDKEGYRLNVPVLCSEKKVSAIAAEKRFVGISGEGVYVEVIKFAEDGDDIILRSYENHGSRTAATIDIPGLNARAVYACDMLEQNTGDAAYRNGAITAVFTPYEIKTFRVVTEKITEKIH
ncbi:MAG: alpha-mannosidase [Spirochaetes bacterium]|nr:alpha-mannosidase [Spirochaetota bacterium]